MITPKLSQQQAAERLRKLPSEIREVLFAETTGEKIIAIGQQHGLLLDKIGDLIDIVGDFLLGAIHPNNFSKDLEQALNISSTEASKIAQDINKEVFVPIHNHLLKIHNMQDSEKISFADGPGMSIGTPTLPAASIVPVRPSSFGDLKVELQRTIEREGGSASAPKSIPVQTVDAPAPPNQTKSTYKGADPYRESPEEEALSVEKKGGSLLPAGPNTKPDPASPSKFSFASLRKDTPEKILESVPTPTPYRSGVFQKKPQNSPFEEMQRKEVEPKPAPHASMPAANTTVTPTKGHITTPDGFRGFRMSEGGNLAHLREQPTEAVETVPYALPKSTPTPTIHIPVVAPAPTEQDVAEKEAVKPISQKSSGDPYREPTS